DVKFTALIGLFLGGYVLLALFLGSLIGSVYGITLILLKRIKKRDTIPFGPFLALGALITLFFGPQIFYFYLSFWG
ncbi:MAG TPA: A24 family peptidase, partial [Candidatus Subteraquimicrobiales bacterium]